MRWNAGPTCAGITGRPAWNPHQASYAMLTACLAGLSKVQEDTRRPVDAVTSFDGRSDQAKKAGILLPSTGDRNL